MFERIKDADGGSVRHAERDPIVVEAPGAPHKGVNAELVYLRGQVEAQLLEHDGLGGHDTPKIPRVFVSAYWDGATIEATHECYGDRSYGPDAVDVTRTGTGTYEIQINKGIPADTNIAILDVTTSLNHIGAPTPHVIVRLSARLSSDLFEVKRYEGPRATMVLADGNFQLLIFAESVL